jgi:hypothetical protein
MLLRAEDDSIECSMTLLAAAIYLNAAILLCLCMSVSPIINSSA